MPATQARASLKRLGGRLPQGRMREMKLNQKMVALVIGHSGTWNNAMIYVSEHQTIDFQCPIPMPKTTFIYKQTVTGENGLVNTRQSGIE